VWGEDAGVGEGDAGEVVEVDLLEVGEAGGVREAGGGEVETLIELNLFEGVDGGEEFEGAAGDLGEAGVVVADVEGGDVGGGGVVGVAAVHAGEAFEVGAMADVEEAVVVEADGGEFAE